MSDYALRPATTADARALWTIKKSCLRRYVEETWGVWDERLQHEHFSATFDPHETRVIATAAGCIGYLAVRAEPRELNLLNIMIAPAHQHRGLGTAILRELLADAQSRRVPVRLQVLRVNPARALYERLGFAVYEETPTHFRMRWRPA